MASDVKPYGKTVYVSQEVWDLLSTFARAYEGADAELERGLTNPHYVANWLLESFFERNFKELGAHREELERARRGMTEYFRIQIEQMGMKKQQEKKGKKEKKEEKVGSEEGCE